MFHRDSLGTLARHPAGRGQPDDGGARHRPFRARDAARRKPATRRLFGIQAWAALPKSHEEAAPAFVHHGTDELPRITGEGKRVRLVMGRPMARARPWSSRTRRLFAEAVLAPGAVLPLDPDYDERAVYVASGEIDIAGDTFGEGRLLVFKPGDRISILANAQSRLMLLGGEPMDGPRHIWWNFVSSSKERIEQAQGGLARQALRARAGRREGVHPAARVSAAGRGVRATLWGEHGVRVAPAGRLRADRCRSCRPGSASPAARSRDGCCRAASSCWRGALWSAPAPAGAQCRRCGRRGRRARRMLLKEQLRQRLSEPGALFAERRQRRADHGRQRGLRGRHRGGRAHGAAGGGRTPRQGQGAAAQAHGRQRRGHGELNGSAGRPIGASSVRSRCSTASADALRAYAQRRRAGAGGRRGADAGGRPASARRQPRRGRGRLPPPDRARQGRTARGFMRYRGHAMLGDVHAAARGAPTRRWRPTGGAARGEGAAASASPTMPSCQRDLSVTCDRIGDMHARKRDLDAALASYRQRPRDRRGAGRSAIRRTRSGSTICPSATTASATCSTSRAIATARWRASARAWPSPGAGQARARERAVAVGPLRQPRPHRRRR